MSLAGMDLHVHELIAVLLSFLLPNEQMSHAVLSVDPESVTEMITRQPYEGDLPQRDMQRVNNAEKRISEASSYGLGHCGLHACI